MVFTTLANNQVLLKEDTIAHWTKSVKWLYLKPMKNFTRPQRHSWSLSGTWPAQRWRHPWQLLLHEPKIKAFCFRVCSLGKFFLSSTITICNANLHILIFVNVPQKTLTSLHYISKCYKMCTGFPRYWRLIRSVILDGKYWICRKKAIFN